MAGIFKTVALHPEFTGSYEYCITVPKTLIQDCRLQVSRQHLDLIMLIG